MNFSFLCTISALPTEGSARSFRCGARTVCVARINGVLTAVDDVCPHRGGPLGQGEVEGSHIICPWHGWQFDAWTGQSTNPPGTAVDRFEIKIEGDEVFARQK
jgi:nitrite reductase (NADH) small subunit